MPPKVLIIGASGFIGSNLARRLIADGYKVSVFTRNSSNLWRLSDILPSIRIYSGDLLEKETIRKVIAEEKPEVVYHFATYGGYPSQKDFDIMVQTNILGSLNLFRALGGHDFLKGIVNIGSSSEYGQKSAPMGEMDFIEPNTPYAITKASQTLFGRYFSKNRNLPLITLRFFSVYGPYEEPGRLITDLMIAAVCGQKVKLSSPLPRRDFVCIEDALNACIKAAEFPVKKGEVFNIGSGQDFSIGEVVAAFEEILGKKLEIEWGAEEKKRSFDAGQKWIADISKAKTMLNWKPVYSLKDGLKKTYNWYRDNIHLYERQKKN